LRSFCFYAPFIKNEEWELLCEFLKIQNNLELIDLTLECHNSPKTRYLQQNAYLANFIKELENKKSLKYLYLKSNAWSLEALSQGLAGLKLMNQLTRFTFEGSDDTITSQQPAWKRVEGLCSFIKSQKESLKVLRVILPCVLEENITTHIAEAISHLTNLRELHLYTNTNTVDGRESVMNYFQDVIQQDIPVESRLKLKRSKAWNPNLAKYFKRLKNLQDFSLQFDITEKQSTDWFVDLMKVLPSLEKLRNMSIKTDSGKFIEHRVEKKIIPVVKELWNLKSISLEYTDVLEEDYDDSSEEEEDGSWLRKDFSLRKTVKKVNERQSLRCDLMF